MFPVDVQYIAVLEHKDIVETVAQKLIEIHIKSIDRKGSKASHDGDILVFLPGADDVDRARKFVQM